MRFITFFLTTSLGCVFFSQLWAQTTPREVCPRETIASAVPQPKELLSRNGRLDVQLSYESVVDARGLKRYCYIDQDGNQSPTLRVRPGDQVTLRLSNNLGSSTQPSPVPSHSHDGEVCASAAMSITSTNLHFHGLSIPPTCHQDDTLNTLIAPSQDFEYKFQIPADQPPGLYWYHPHVHGFAREHALGGASGALIVEGLQAAVPETAGLPERTFIVRDQDLINPDAQPVQTDSMPAPQVLRDAEGDILNSGTGTGKPAKDLSLNFVPVPFPDYKPAVITMKAGERELWRLLNASAITYLDLQVLLNDRPQFVGVAAIDGVPVNSNGGKESIIWRGHVLVPPGGRVEFIVKSPPAKVRAMFVTRTVDTGPAGENDPTRPLAEITVSATGGDGNHTSNDSSNRGSVSPLPSPAPPARTSPVAALSQISPVRRRKLYFSERPLDSRDPKSPTIFTLTVDGQEPLPFDPAHAMTPNLVVQQGDVEDWIIENRTTELHDFHIHQLHFQLLEWNGVPVSEPFLRDTINVAYWDGRSPVYPSVRVRMDFRNPNIVGTFVYHCHLLEHEDGGMMGIIRVEPASRSAGSSKR